MKLQKQLFPASLTCLAIAGAINKGSSVLQSWTHLTSLDLDYLYFVFLALTFLLFLLAIGHFFVRRTIDNIRFQRRARKSQLIYEEKPISDESIRQIALVDAAAFPHDETTELELHMLNQENEAYLRCWRIRKDNSLAGFFILSCLSKKATQKIQDRIFRCAADIDSEDFLKTFRGASSLYIHDVLGVDKPGLFSIKGIILRELVTEVRSRCMENPNIRHIFCRPVNDDGRRVAHNFGFKPIVYLKLGKEIWQIDCKDILLS